jgi:hypothetical protein
MLVGFWVGGCRVGSWGFVFGSDLDLGVGERNRRGIKTEEIWLTDQALSKA